ncbi:hypothetical protein Hanom_Chr09g00832471 [Helianthus anomalus]
MFRLVMYFYYISLLNTMGYGTGLGRGLGTNTQVIISGGLGFWRGTLGGGFSPGIGRGYQVDMRDLIG